MKGALGLILGLIVILAPSPVPPPPAFVFCMDVSGSMDGARMGRALRGYLEIAQQPVDEMCMTVVAFDTGAVLWPKGWVELPDSEAVEAAQAWVVGQGAHGGTRAAPALSLALKQPKPKLTVVLVTDGEFYQERPAEVIGTVWACQEWRKKQGWTPARLAVVSVGKSGQTAPILLELAQLGHGGLFRAE